MADQNDEDTSMTSAVGPATQEQDAPTQNGDTPIQIEGASSDSGSGSDSDEEEEGEEEEEETEWMVTTREKRSTAGNRLSSLIQQEEPDDELELLFAEDDDDAGFEDAEADQSDVQMDSSDDDEDQGPAAGADDLDGEKELQRAAKAEKTKKKRKLNDGIPIFKKRVKIDPTASQAPGPRPKKKSERASWIPATEDLPTRASQRGTTKQQKKALHAQMVDREVKRLRQLENMEKAAATKNAAKKPAMTQADRLAEAARIEKANARSLSRWEEAEQRREEEQRAKLAALSNRHLEGPVITWWSGVAEWVGGKLKQVGKTLVIEEPKEKPATAKKRKLAEMEAGSEAAASETPKPDGEVASSKPGLPPTSGQPIIDPSLAPAANSPLQESKLMEQTSPPPPPELEITPSDQNQGESVPSPQSFSQQSTPSIVPEPLPEELPVQQNVSAPLANTPLLPQETKPAPMFAPPPPPPPSTPSHPPFILAPPQAWNPNQPPLPPPRASLNGSAPIPGLGYNPSPLQYPHLTLTQTAPFQFLAPPPPQPEIPKPPAHETTSRNLVILANFDEVQVKDKNVQTQILFGRKFLKASKPKSHSLCAITSQPARYRDPQTGLAYYNMYAYKEIQKLKKGEYKWSALVGAYVGPGTFAARGVPSRFLKGGECEPAIVQ